MQNKITTLSAVLLLPFLLLAQEDYKDKNTLTEYLNPQPYEVQEFSSKNRKKTPKNVILMISDGMGHAHLHAALTANRGQLYIKSMRHLGLSKTHSANRYTTDSAAGGTAIACGEKTYNGAIGVNSDTLPLPTLLQNAEKLGKASGLVSTSSITHATPASFIAHQPQRSMYEAIAADFLTTDIDLFIGGGYRFFTERKDGRNLVKELEDKGYIFAQSLNEVQDFKSGSLAVLTAEEHNPRYTERGDLLPQAIEKALEVLSHNSKKGFFLMVEGSQIDWGGHQNDISYLVEEMLDFDRAVGKALSFAAKDGNTLVIVTADHETGGLTLEDGCEEKGYVKAQFSTGDHTAVGVPVFAFGSGAEHFIGIYENTAIFHKIMHLWGK